MQPRKVKLMMPLGMLVHMHLQPVGRESERGYWKKVTIWRLTSVVDIQQSNKVVTWHQSLTPFEKIKDKSKHLCMDKMKKDNIPSKDKVVFGLTWGGSKAFVDAWTRI